MTSVNLLGLTQIAELLIEVETELAELEYHFSARGAAVQAMREALDRFEQSHEFAAGSAVFGVKMALLGKAVVS